MEIGTNNDKMMDMQWYEHATIFHNTFALGRCPYHGMSIKYDFALSLTRWCFDSSSSFFFAGYWLGAGGQVRLTDISGGNLVEGGLVDYHNHDDFSITITLVSDEDDYSYCSITDAAQVQCGRATMAAKWATHHLAKDLPGTCQVLDRYLSGTCQVLVRYLPVTCQVHIG